MSRETARAILIDGDLNILLLRRHRPGEPIYWTAPGGGVELGKSREAALARELLEELGATAEISTSELLYKDGTSSQTFYLAHLISLDLSLRSGPEMIDPSRGSYELERIPFERGKLERINVKPGVLRDYLIDQWPRLYESIMQQKETPSQER